MKKGRMNGAKIKTVTRTVSFIIHHELYCLDSSYFYDFTIASNVIRLISLVLTHTLSPTDFVKRRCYCFRRLFIPDDRFSLFKVVLSGTYTVLMAGFIDNTALKRTVSDNGQNKERC